MTRHRASEAVTAPIALPGSRTGPRHRSPGRSALRHGAVAVGITGTALAAVAPASLQLPAPLEASGPTTASLALSAGGAALPAPRRVSPVAEASPAAASSDLLKATDRARATAAARPAPAAAPATPAAAPAVTDAGEDGDAQGSGADLDCGATGSYGGVKASVREVGHAIECVWPGREILGVGSRSNHSDHPSGYALDVMTTDGDALASCLTRHRDDLGISYVIWDQRIDTGRGWKRMEDRGGATANHEDHVHVSFTHGGGRPDVSVLRGCG